MSERKAVIKNADMSEDMQQDAVDCASQALEKYNIEKVCLLDLNSERSYSFHGLPDHLISLLFPMHGHLGYCSLYQEGI